MFCKERSFSNKAGEKHLNCHGEEVLDWSKIQAGRVFVQISIWNFASTEQLFLKKSQFTESMTQSYFCKDASKDHHNFYKKDSAMGVVSFGILRIFLDNRLKNPKDNTFKPSTLLKNAEAVTGGVSIK